MTPLALLAVHIAVFGTGFLSLSLLALFVVPGAVYGALFAFPQPRLA